MPTLKIHLKIYRANRWPGPACSPPWVDEDGNHVSPLTMDSSQVTCKSCRRTDIFRQHQASEEPHPNSSRPFSQGAKGQHHLATTSTLRGPVWPIAARCRDGWGTSTPIPL